MNLEQSFTYEAVEYHYTNLKDQYSTSSSITRNKTLIIPKHTKIAANSLALSFLKIYLLIPLINFYFQYLKFNSLFYTERIIFLSLKKQLLL